MIARALRAQAQSLVGDVVLVWVAAAAFVMSLSLATSIPPEFSDAPADIRAALTAPFSAVLATYGAIFAAVYGSFRYTIDRRDGVVAQRLMLQPRWVSFLVRLPAVAFGGVVVALVGAVGGHAALTLTMGGIPVEWPVVGCTAALGALASLWGLGVGVVIQAHLVALFVASMSLGAAMIVAMIWAVGASYLPLLTMLEAFRFDVAAVGILQAERLDSSTAALLTAGWVLLALLAGGFLFMRRDVK